MFIQKGHCYKYTFIKLHPSANSKNITYNIYIYVHINLIHQDLELIILVNTGIAELVYLFVEPDGTCILGLELVFGLESGSLSKKSVCNGLL